MYYIIGIVGALTKISHDNVVIINNDKYMRSPVGSEKVNTTFEIKNALPLRGHLQPEGFYIFEKIGDTTVLTAPDKEEKSALKFKKRADYDKKQLFKLSSFFFSDKYNIMTNDGRCLELEENQYFFNTCRRSNENQRFLIEKYDSVMLLDSNKSITKKLKESFYLTQKMGYLSNVEDDDQIEFNLVNDNGIEFKAEADGYNFTLSNKKNGKYLDTTESLYVKLRSKSDNENQLFTFRPLDDNTVNIISVADKNCLSRQDKILIKERCTTAGYQKFKLSNKEIAPTLYFLSLPDSGEFLSTTMDKQYITTTSSITTATKFAFREEFYGFTVIHAPSAGQFVQMNGQYVGLNKDKPAVFRIRPHKNNLISITLGPMCMTYLPKSGKKFKFQRCRGSYDQIFEKFAHREDKAASEIIRLRNAYMSLRNYTSEILPEVEPYPELLMDAKKYSKSKNKGSGGIKGVGSLLEKSSKFVGEFASDPLKASTDLLKKGIKFGKNKLMSELNKKKESLIKKTQDATGKGGDVLSKGSMKSAGEFASNPLKASTDLLKEGYKSGKNKLMSELNKKKESLIKKTKDATGKGGDVLSKGSMKSAGEFASNPLKASTDLLKEGIKSGKNKLMGELNKKKDSLIKKTKDATGNGGDVLSKKSAIKEEATKRLNEQAKKITKGLKSLIVNDPIHT